MAQIKNPGSIVTDSGFKKYFGGDLLSHTASRAVPSALKSLTAVFGMGTGVTSSLLPPKIDYSALFRNVYNLSSIKNTDLKRFYATYNLHSNTKR